jgi:predicted RNA methylase
MISIPSSVGPTPTPVKHVRNMLNLADVNENDIVYDLGSGDGRVLLIALEECRVKRAVGIELDLFQVKKSRKLLNNNSGAEIRHGDLFNADINEATVITFYLSKEYNKTLKEKLQKLDVRIVSYSFPVDGWQPIEVKKIDNKMIYLYEVGE